MKFRNLLIVALVSMGFCAPVNANSLTFQGVTFGIDVIDANSITFSILNATSATGDWSGIGYLDAFQFKNFGDVGATSTAIVTPNEFDATVTSSLSAGGCGTNGTAGMCFTANPAHLALASSMNWQIDFNDVANIDWAKYDPETGLYGPHLSILFSTFDNSTNSYVKTGSLLSDTIPTAVPEPEIYAMLSIGLGLMGWIGRRRKLHAA